MAPDEESPVTPPSPVKVVRWVPRRSPSSDELVRVEAAPRASLLSPDPGSPALSVLILTLVLAMHVLAGILAYASWHAHRLAFIC